MNRIVRIIVLTLVMLSVIGCNAITVECKSEGTIIDKTVEDGGSMFYKVGKTYMMMPLPDDYMIDIEINNGEHVYIKHTEVDKSIYDMLSKNENIIVIYDEIYTEDTYEFKDIKIKKIIKEEF
jgi:hypothetical protein